MHDYSEMTQPFKVVNPENEVRWRCVKIAETIKAERPEFLNQPDVESYNRTVAEMATGCFERGIALSVIWVLLPRVSDLSQLASQLGNLQRRGLRPKQSEKEVRIDLKKIIESQPELIENLDRNHLAKDFSICVQQVMTKHINNRDFATYVEGARSLEEVRKMCMRAKDRRTIKK